MTPNHRSRVLALLAIAAGCLAPREAVPQTPTPAEIVRAIQSYGSAMPVWSHVGFTACPQADARGRAVFEAIASAPIPPVALRELSLRWKQTFTDCDYVPLEAWFEAALIQVTDSADQMTAFQFLSSLPTDINDSLRQTLWRAAESGRFSSEVSAAFASAAVRSTDPSEWITRTIAALRDRDVGAEWVQLEAGALLREHPSAFLPELVRGSSGITDQRLTEVLSVVGAAVGRGLVTRSTSGLAALRGIAAERPAIPEHIRMALDPD